MKKSASTWLLQLLTQQLTLLSGYFYRLQLGETTKDSSVLPPEEIVIMRVRPRAR